MNPSAEGYFRTCLVYLSGIMEDDALKATRLRWGGMNMLTATFKTGLLPRRDLVRLSDLGLYVLEVILQSWH